jgi:Mg-chelatase subunit ChlD
MRGPVVALLAVLLAVLAHAHADDATEDDDALRWPTRASLRLAGTMARIEARFVIDVEGPALTSTNMFSFALPPDGVVTAGSVRVGSHVQALALGRPETIARDLAQLTSGSGTPRAWAIHIETTPIGATRDQAVVGVVAPRPARMTLDVTIEAPTCFFADARHVLVPERWRVRGGAPFARADELAEACGRATESENWVSVPARALARRQPGEQRIGVIASRLPLQSQHLARVEIDLAGTLSEVPGDLHTAIIVDASRSMTDEKRASQRATVDAYLRATPLGRVQLIAYARDARALLPSWTPAITAAPLIARAFATLIPKNGSNVDVALAVAGEWLARTRGTRRVIVFTDELVARELGQRLETHPDSITAGLPTKTIVHAVHLFGDGGTLVRDDDALLARVASATEGICVQGGADERSTIDASILVRPLSLDNITISGPGWRELDDLPLACNSARLLEGHTCAWLAEGTAAAGPITFAGFLWGRRIVRVVQPDPGHARALARMLVHYTGLTHELHEQVQRAALAVNDAWSLFATWGARSGGYPDEPSGGGTGWGTICDCRGFGTIGHGSGTGSALSSDSVQRQLAASVRACKPRSQVTVELETTRDEIVAVTVAVDDTRAVRACIEEAIWSAAVTIPGAPGHAHTTLQFD